MTGQPARRHRVLVTFELPAFYAEDMTREALAEWMKGTDMTYEDALLEEMRISTPVVVVVESHGEKDSEVIATTGLLHAVAVEEVPPSEEPGDDETWRLYREGWKLLQHEADRQEERA